MMKNVQMIPTPVSKVPVLKFAKKKTKISDWELRDLHLSNLHKKSVVP